MFSFKLFAVAALACAVVATESCAPAVTITVTNTVKECASPGVPAPTSSGYAPLPPVEGTTVLPAPPAPSASGPATPSVAPPAAPGHSSAETSVPAIMPSSAGAPLAPSSSAASESASGSAPANGTTIAPSSTAAVTRPTSSTSTVLQVSSAMAAMATPLVGFGALVGAMAAFA